MAPRKAMALYIEGENHYRAGWETQAFDLYHRAIVQILGHEDIHQKLSGVPEHFPEETIAVLWQHLMTSFRKSGSVFTQEAYPDAFKLMLSFRPASSREHPQFKGAQGERLLKAMQITTAFTLGLIAWDQGEQAIAAKRYQEALDVAATHAPFNAWSPGLKHLDKHIASEVQQIKHNLGVLMMNDTITANMAGSAQGGLRKDVVNLPYTRFENGRTTEKDTVVIGTDACGRPECSNRGVSFKRCSACKKTAYCSVECQRADWKKHKLTHS
ncbi:hypothetical protein FB451DRAFT_1233341 [Mycena latifolia]|nr:hypothetical protein FB451DRAFT_1233341 [Mycena latifolia]